MSIIGLTITVLCFLAGLAGTFIPVLPGAPLIFLGLIVYGFFDHFVHLHRAFYLGQLILVVLTLGVDYLAGIWGVRHYGGSRWAVGGSLLGAVVGLLLLGPVGVIVGPFLGAVAGELCNRSSPNQAIRAGIGTMVGFLGGALIKIALELVMIIWFIYAVK